MAENRVIDLTPGADEAMKPSELIRVTGHQTLSLAARRAITLLWHNAHRQGIEVGKDYSIELATLRTDGHKGSDVVEDAIVSLMQTVLTAQLPDGRTRRVQFLGGNDLDDPSRPRGVLTYSFDRRLVELLQDSRIWGRIAIPILMAFSSKYAVTLYENTCQWSGLTHKTWQDMSLADFRGLIGIEDGKYEAFGSLNKHVIGPAVDEIVALAPYNISIIPIKEGRRVAQVRVAWWPKNELELREAFVESQRSKVGRRARIAGTAERVTPVRSVQAVARQARLERQRSLQPVIDVDDQP